MYHIACALTGVEGLPRLGAGAVGLDHFQDLGVLLQRCRACRREATRETMQTSGRVGEGAGLSWAPRLLFLVVKSSSEGFLSGFLLGSNFFMFFGLLLKSCKQRV